jgi:predicted Zn-dependent protease
LITPGAPLTGNEPTQRAALRDQLLASGSRAGVLLGAQAALDSSDAAGASARLLEWVVLRPRDALAWQLLARARQAQGQTLRAVRAEAESRAAQYDFAGSLERFKAAQGLPERLRAADPIELAIVDSRRREVEEKLRLWESEK